MLDFDHGVVHMTMNRALKYSVTSTYSITIIYSLPAICSMWWRFGKLEILLWVFGMRTGSFQLLWRLVSWRQKMLSLEAWHFLVGELNNWERCSAKAKNNRIGWGGREKVSESDREWDSKHSLYLFQESGCILVLGFWDIPVYIFPFCLWKLKNWFLLPATKFF